MTDYRMFYDKDSLGSWDLGGQDRVVTIETVKGGTVGGHQGTKKERKPILTFVGKRKRFICNITNAATIASLYGPHVEKWVGQRIVLYPTTTTFGRETRDCIRIRPVKPSAGQVDTPDDMDRPAEPADPGASEAAE